MNVYAALKKSKSIIFGIVSRVSPKFLPPSAYRRMSPSTLSRADGELYVHNDVIGFGHTLIVAPHPDDETLGCGGLIAQMTRSAQTLQVLFVSDGSASHGFSEDLSKLDLARIRKQEALAAVKALGLNASATDFLGMQDGRLPLTTDVEFDEAVRLVEVWLASCKAKTIFLPWRRDSSRDHRAVWQVFDAALRRGNSTRRVIEYPVWAWMFNEDVPKAGEVIVRTLNITSELKLKRLAISCYKSQMGGLPFGSGRAFELPRSFLAHFNQPRELFFESMK